MASIDVSAALMNPDFLDSATCIRSTETVGDDGVAVVATQEIPFIGSIQSYGRQVERLSLGGNAEFSRGQISITTMFRLIDGAGDKTADIVAWNGNRYTVTAVSDFNNWGAGFSEAICDLIPLSPA